MNHLEAMKQALEDFRRIRHHFDTDEYGWEVADKAITTLRTAIEQAEKQEPVAQVVNPSTSLILALAGRQHLLSVGAYLYTTPPAAPVQDQFRDATKMMEEPFGYFKAEPFGWTDCAETDEGAIALYKRPAAQRQCEDDK
jgi:hypothetical protein